MSTLDQFEIAALLSDATIGQIEPNATSAIRNAIRQQAPQIFAEAEINSINRIAHFFAQIIKETGRLKRLDENLNYTSAARLREIFPSKFPSVSAAKPYVGKPEKIANYVYANRNGNGNVASGDGWRYRGSGLIQLTGKGNFKAVGQEIGLGLELVQNPDAVRTPSTAVAVAVGYWTARDINSVADGQTNADVDKVTRRINPYESSAGKQDRRDFFMHALTTLRDADAAHQMLTKMAATTKKSKTRKITELAVQREQSTEPNSDELLMDRINDDKIIQYSAPFRSIPKLYWPANDKNAADYNHVSQIDTDAALEGNFSLTHEDLELLVEANAFRIPANIKRVTIALRGATLGAEDEQVDKLSIDCMDVRPNHAQLRCLIGIWRRDTKKMTLFSGSTVPCPRYMKNYYFKMNGLPHSSINCNMLPTGHYVMRVGAHDGGKIKPALRMSEPNNISRDAKVCVWRTSNDLTYGTADVLDEPGLVYDNVHCTYFINHQTTYEASFSSAGCLTVRGRKDPSHQWAKFQAELNKIGQGKRTDMILLTGKEAAIASQGRLAGVNSADLAQTLRRLRVGSSGPAVMRLQTMLGIEATGELDPETQQHLWRWQSANGYTPDAIFAPSIDKATGGVFA